MTDAERERELDQAHGNAWSFFNGAAAPSGTYIGSRRVGNTTFYYYKDGSRYWFEDDFDREMRQKLNEKKRRERQERQQAGYNGRKRRW